MNVETLRFQFETTGTKASADAVQNMEKRISSSLRLVRQSMTQTTRKVQQLRHELSRLNGSNAVVKVTVNDLSRERRDVNSLANALDRLGRLANSYNFTITVTDVAREARAVDRLARALTVLQAAPSSFLIPIVVTNVAREIRQVRSLATALTQLQAAPSSFLIPIVVTDVAREARAVNRLTASLTALQAATQGSYLIPITVTDVSRQARAVKRLADNLALLTAQNQTFGIMVAVSDVSGEARAIKRLADNLGTLNGIARNAYTFSIAVTDVDNEAKSVGRLQRALTKMQTLRDRYSYVITTVIDDEATKSTGRLSRSLKNLESKDILINIRVNSLEAEIRQVERLAAAIRLLKDKSVTVRTENSGSSPRGGGLGAIGNVGGRIGDMVGGMLKFAATTVLATVKVTLLAGAITMAAAATGPLVAVLGGGLVAVAAGSLTAMAAGFAGIAGAAVTAGIGVGAFALFAGPSISKVTGAWGEYRTAMEEAKKANAAGDVEAYTKAMKKADDVMKMLSPTQREVFDNLKGLSESWRSTAERFEPTAFKVFNEAIGAARDALPALIAVAEPAGEAIANVLTKIREGLKSEQFTDFMNTVKVTTGPIIEQFGQVGLNIAGAIGNGIQAGMPLINAVMESLVANSAKMESFFASDSFKEFVAIGIDMMPAFGDAAGSLFKALFALLKGIAPLAEVALGVLADLGDRMAVVFTSPAMAQFIENVTELAPYVGAALEAVASAFLAVGDLLAPLGAAVMMALVPLGQAIERLVASDAAHKFVGALVTILPTLVPILEVLGGAFLTLVGGVADGLADLAPTILTVLQTLAPAFESLVGGVLAVLVPALKFLLPIIAEVIAALAGENGLGGLLSWVGSQMGNLGPLFESLTPFLEMLLKNVEPLLPAFLELGRTFMDALVPSLQRIVEFVGFMAPLFFSLIEPLMGVLNALLPLVPVVLDFALSLYETLWPVIIQIIKVLAPLIEKLATGLKPIIEGLKEPILTVVGVLGDMLLSLTPLLEPIVNLALAIGELLVPVLTLLAGFIKGVWLIIRPLITILAELVGWCIGGVADALRLVAALLTGDLAGAWDIVVERAKGMLHFFSNIGTWLYDSGKALINGFVEGIKAMGTAPFEAVKGILGDLRDLFPRSPAKVGPFSGSGYTTHSGKALVEDFGVGMAAAFESPNRVLREGLAGLSSGFAAESLPAGARTGAGNGGGRTILLKGDYSLNGKTLATADPGSLEGQVLRIIRDHDNALAEALEADSKGGMF